VVEETVGLRALMNMSGYTGPAKEYIASLNEMIRKHKELEAGLKEQAAAFQTSTSEIKRAALAIKQQTKEAAAAEKKMAAEAAAAEKAAEVAAKRHSLQIQALGRSLASVGRMSQQFGRDMTRTVTLPIVGAGVATGKFATDFEYKMAAIQSIGRQSNAQLQSLANQFLDMSTDIARSNASALELADTFYYLQGSGFAGSEGMVVLKAAALAAQAGMVSVQQAAEALIYSLNAYGASAADAQHFSDVLFRTVDVGVVNYNELSGAIGYVAGDAASAGITFEELGAAVALVSKQTKGASRATRELDTFIKALVDPSQKLDEAFKSISGHSAAWILQNEGLGRALQILYQATGGTSEAIHDLIGEQRGARAAFALLQDDANKFVDMLSHFQDVTGATADAAAIMSDTTAAAFKNLKNSVIAAAIDLGTAYLPLLREWTQNLTDLAEALSNASDEQKKFWVRVAIGVAGFGPVLSMSGRAVELIGNLIVLNKQLAGGLAGSAKALAGPGGVIALLGLVVAAAVKLNRENEKALVNLQNTEHSLLANARSYEEYRRSAEKAIKALPEYQIQVGLSNGKNTEFRKGLILTREEFERINDMLKHLGSTTEAFSASLDEGNLSVKALRNMAAEGVEPVSHLRDELARYAEMWAIEPPVDLAEWATAWKEQTNTIRDIFLGMADILRENEDALNQAMLEGEIARADIIAENNAKILAMREEQQLKVIALENAYLARRADLEAAHDEEGLEKLDEAYQKKRLKMEQSFSQEEINQKAANKRKLIEQERAQLEELISLHESNAKKIEAQREKLGMTVFLAGLEKAMENGEIDQGEKTILYTLAAAFGLRIDTQMKYAEDSLALTEALGSAQEAEVAETAARINAEWEKLAQDQRNRVAALRDELGAMPRPESVTGGADYSSLFTDIGGSAPAAGGTATTRKESAVKSLRDTVDDVTKTINEAIDAFEKLAKYRTSARLKQALTDIANDIVSAVTILSIAMKTSEGLSKKDAKRTAQFAEYAGQVATNIGDAAGAFEKVGQYVSVSESRLRLIAGDMAKATSIMYQTWASGEGIANRAAKFAEHIDTIASVFGNVAETFSAARYYTGISRSTMVRVGQDMDQMARILEWHMKKMGPELLPRAEEFAESGSAIAKLFGDSVASLKMLQTYSGVSRSHSERFANDMARVMKEYAWVFGKLGKNVGPLAVEFAKSADSIMGTVKDAVEALAAMRWYGGVSDRRIRRLVSDIAKIVWLLNRELGKLGIRLLQDTSQFSQDGQAALELVANGVEPLVSLQEYSGLAEETSERFAEDLAMTIENIGQTLSSLSPDALPYAAEFSEDAMSVTDMVKNAVDALVSLQDDYKGVDAEKIERLREDLMLLATSMSNLGRVDEVLPGLVQFLDVISQLVTQLNELPDRIHIEFSAGGNIPSFQEGGVVPGPPSQPTLAIVHGGERIIPAVAPSNNMTVVNNREYNWQVDVQYANTQSEASLRDDIEMLQLLSVSN